LERYFDYKLKYLQFLNSGISFDDLVNRYISEYFDNEIDLAQNQIPSISQMQNALEEYVKTKDKKDTTEVEDSVQEEDKRMIDSQKSEIEKKKKAPDLKFVDYENETELIDRDNLMSGNYYIKDGVLVKGDPDLRSTALYSNWHAGNVDPQDLQR
jgi:hypothetical protein